MRRDKPILNTAYDEMNYKMRTHPNNFQRFESQVHEKEHTRQSQRKILVHGTCLHGKRDQDFQSLGSEHKSPGGLKRADFFVSFVYFVSKKPAPG
jgi:hypothetical protein